MWGSSGPAEVNGKIPLDFNRAKISPLMLWTCDIADLYHQDRKLWVRFFSEIMATAGLETGSPSCEKC